MRKKRIPIAISYDFDGTLAPGNMQEFDFIPEIGATTKKFWAEVARLAEEHEADNILMYMRQMLKKAKEAEVQVRKKNFSDFGAHVELFDGVLEWFDRIDKYGQERGADVKHFIISSGLREMIEGTSIGKKFEKIFASSFFYDHHGVAEWPALALNYTTKTQYLFRINKGILNVHDHKSVNNFVPHSKRPVPFSNMLYIGDGETDIPCFRLVKDQGGHSIAVYPAHTKGAKEKAQKLIQEERVNYSALADYCEGSKLDLYVKAVVDKVTSAAIVASTAQKG